jgi:hypothetical protein
MSGERKMFPDIPEEMTAVREVMVHADAWGYGNLIHRMKYAWFLKLTTEGLKPVTAAHHAGLSSEEVNKISKLKNEKLEIFLDDVRKYIGEKAG